MAVHKHYGQLPPPISSSSSSSNSSPGSSMSSGGYQKITGAALKRLQKEMKSFVSSPPDGLELDEETLQGNDLGVWKVKMAGPTNTLYDGEQFVIQFKFNVKYPFDSPEVTFVGPPETIPVHQHIYSNGHICLSILTDDWSPALSVESVCLSILSMLASAKEKSRPPDDAFYIKTCSKNPKKTHWWYHDDSV